MKQLIHQQLIERANHVVARPISKEGHMALFNQFGVGGC